jgi:ABC-type transport system involved in multi-copper enzyme maturation permease subunit
LSAAVAAMLFGPIFSVELVTTARRARHLLLRVLCAGFLAFVLVAAYQEYVPVAGGPVPINRLAEFAKSFFAYFAFTQVFVVLLFTPALTAGTISLERERRTIEYLFATDLSNSEIVLGKLAARLVVVLCLVAAGMPILSVATLLGGIEPQWLYMVLVVALSTTLVLAALGIAVSVATKRSRDAVVRTYVLLVAALVMPLIVEGILLGPAASSSMRTVLRPINDELLDANPLVALTRIFSSWTKPQDWYGVGKLALYHAGLAVLCLVPAVAAVRRRHLKSFEVPTLSRPGQRARSRRAVGLRPLLWKEMYVGRTRSQHAWATRIAMLLMVGAIVALTLWIMAQTVEYSGYLVGSRELVEIYLGTANPLAATLGSLGLLVLAAWSAASITTEKERDTWVSLLCTTLTPREIIVGKVMGNLYAARWVLLLPLIVYAPALLFSPDFALALPFIIGTQLVLCVFVTVMGVLFSLKSRNTLRAMGGTLSVTFLLGGGYLLCCCMPLFMGGGPGRGNEILMFTPCMPFLLSAPCILYEHLRDPGYGSFFVREGGFVAYVFGMLGYGVASVVLFFVSTANFEALAGRSTPRDWQAGYPPTLPKPGSDRTAA